MEKRIVIILLTYILYRPTRGKFHRCESNEHYILYTI